MKVTITKTTKLVVVAPSLLAARDNLNNATEPPVYRVKIETAGEHFPSIIQEINRAAQVNFRD